MEYYLQIVIKGQYGFNKMSKGEFWGKKGLRILLISLFAALVSVFGYFANVGPYLSNTGFPSRISPILYIILYVFLVLLTNLILPLVRELQERPVELKDGPLKEELFRLARSAGYKGEICVAKASPESTSAAYYTLIGRKIVIYENVLPMMGKGEVAAVILQEAGHAIHHDVMKRIVASMVFYAIGVLAMWMMASCMLRSDILSMDGKIPLLSAWGALLTVLLMWLFKFAVNGYSYRKEVLRADAMAARYGLGDHLIVVLKGLAQMDFEDLNPHPVKEYLFDGYPALHHRIQNIRAEEQAH